MKVLCGVLLSCAFVFVGGSTFIASGDLCTIARNSLAITLVSVRLLLAVILLVFLLATMKVDGGQTEYNGIESHSMKTRRSDEPEKSQKRTMVE